MENREPKLSKTIVVIELIWIALMIISLDTILFDYSKVPVDSYEYSLDNVSGYASSSLTISVKEKNTSFIIKGSYKKIVNYDLLKSLKENEKINIISPSKQPIFDKLSKLFGNVTVIKLLNKDGEVIFDRNNSERLHKDKYVGLVLYFVLGWGLVLVITIGWLLYLVSKNSKYEHLLEHPLVRYKLIKGNIE